MSKPLNHIIHIQPAIIRLFVFLSFLVLGNSCITVYDTINNRNFADQYNPAERQMHPEYSIYLKSSDEVRLYFRLFPKEFAYYRSAEDSLPKARISLFFRVTNTYTSTEIIDSLTSSFTLMGLPRPQFLGFVPLNLLKEGKYIIEVFLTDLNAKQTVSTVIEYHQSLSGNSNSFMFTSKYGNPLFYPHFSVTDTFRVRSEMFNQNQIWVSYYKPDLRLPAPPDIQKQILLEPQPVDSTWLVENPDTTLFSFNKEGVYYFANNNGLIGKPYTCFNEFYPYTKTPEELFKPLAYLCTPKELKRYREYPDIKQAVDTFWMQSTNDLDKSRELIRIYYNRVQLANYYFSDYKEGWITDRGMIYTICGAPAIIRKTDEGEYWLYGKGANESTKFFFYREKHTIFGNTYILERSDLYSRMWFNAITTWREGRVFSLNP